jgi:glycosyltransferase involved in cell wall biosynthesis
MKILHVIPTLSQASGGPPEVAINLVRSLRAIDVDAEILTTNHDLPPGLEIPLNQRVEYRNGSVAGQQGSPVPVWFLPYNPPELKEFIFSKALTKWLWENISTYDLIDSHYLFSYAPTCAATIARHKKVPYTMRTMGQLTPWALAQGRLKKQLYSLFIERRNLNGAAAVHCTAAAEAVDVQNFGVKSPTITLPLGVNSPEFIDHAAGKLRQRYGIAAETPILLFLSRMHYKKRPNVLIQSVAQILAQQQDCHLLLAGTGEAEYLQELQQLAAQLGICDRISFVGFVSGYDKNLLLQGADVFVLPSYSENFGIAVAEALAAGLPVIVTPGVQIAPEIAAANAGLVLEADVTELSAALLQLLQQPILRQELGDNGKSLARTRYSWMAIAKDLKSVYETILTQKTLPTN